MRIALLVLIILVGCAQQPDLTPTPLTASIPVSDHPHPHSDVMGCGIELEDEGAVLNPNDEGYAIYAEKSISELEQELDNSGSQGAETIKAFIEHLKTCLTTKAEN